MRQTRDHEGTTRRTFLRQTGLAAAAAPMLGAVAHASGSDIIKVGLIGCGDRGTEAAINATNAGKDIRVVALADIFDERLKAAKETLTTQRKDQTDLPPERCFVGFDAYEQLIGSGVDVVLIAPSSHFTPTIFEAAVSAGKHVFCEKPHGIDIPGIQRVEAACALARQRKLNAVSGLCWRYDYGVRETLKRVRDGAIGEILAIQENYVQPPYMIRERRPDHNEMQYQLWNWYHFSWLSGDQTAQRLIHSLDKASWALGDKPPLRAWGYGGRQTALDPKYGDQFDHQTVIFEYPNDVRVFGFAHAQDECFSDTSDLILGTKGRCNVLAHTIEGEKPWRYDGPKPSMYDVTHAELFAAIREGRTIDDSRHMILSSALAIMAQVAAVTGQAVTWDQLMASTRSFALPRYAWDVEPPVLPGPNGLYPTAMQGKAEAQRWGIA